VKAAKYTSGFACSILRQLRHSSQQSIAWPFFCELLVVGLLLEFKNHSSFASVSPAKHTRSPVAQDDDDVRMAVDIAGRVRFNFCRLLHHWASEHENYEMENHHQYVFDGPSYHGVEKRDK
jgi:hypothetical protein